jgi:uncharacterized protein YndB with AHSA1/START domain
MQSGSSSVAEVGYELSITRVFDAPRELVWKAWTDPEMGKHWMGPRGFQAVEFETPRAAGGTWRLRMVGHVPGTDQLVELKQGGVVKEFRPPELLSYTFAWDDRASVGLSESPFKENLVTVQLEERGRKTVMHFTQTPFATEGERDGHNGGWNSALDCLAEYLAERQPWRAAAPDDVPSELHLKRFFAAPRDVVFAAWTKPEMVAQWWGPKSFTNTVHAWEARGGGAIRVDMQGPDGTVYPMAGRFVEFYPPHRFDFTASALDHDGNAMFENRNSVFFAEVEGGTEISLDVHVVSQTEVAPQYLKGMSAGWSQSLEKLGEYLETA